MEATEERRIFIGLMDKLKWLGDTLKLSFEFGGVDANSLNKMKSIVEGLNSIENPKEYLNSFINDWLHLPEFRPILESWIKQVRNLFDYQRSENTIRVKPEQIGKNYVELVEVYEAWRCTLLIYLAKYLNDGEMVAYDGSICMKGADANTKEESEEEPKEFAVLIKNGYMVRNGQGYSWNKSKALLAYTMEKIYCKSSTDSFPETKLNEMFGVKRLGAARSQLILNKLGDGKPRGADEIDKLL